MLFLFILFIYSVLLCLSCHLYIHCSISEINTRWGCDIKESLVDIEIKKNTSSESTHFIRIDRISDMRAFDLPRTVCDRRFPVHWLDVQSLGERFCETCWVRGEIFSIWNSQLRIQLAPYIEKSERVDYTAAGTLGSVMPRFGWGERARIVRVIVRLLAKESQRELRRFSLFSHFQSGWIADRSSFFPVF